MTRIFGRVVAGFLALVLGMNLAAAEPTHGIAMYGDPSLPPDFVSLPYANPDAPKGGTIVFGETGGFDSLNPYILKGRAPWGIQSHVFETLMARNWDEPFSLYGLLAESIETGPEREWVAFTLRPEAKFSDGSPVTVEDVIWSMETLAEEGQPRYRNAWEKVRSIDQTGERSFRLDFSEPDSELPLIIGLRPILKKADWEGVDFAQSSLRVPTGSGPYTIGAFEPGRYIRFERNPEYWGRDLPINRGLNNFDTIRYDYFVDSGVLFQAFTAGALSVYRESSPARWASEFGFPAVTSGAVVKAEIPHGRPSGMEGFVFNLRRPIFQDWRVRDALLHAFNFEFVNQTLNGGAFPRRASYFANSALAMGEGPAEGRVRELLEPFADSLLPDALEAYALPASDGSPRNRSNMRRAAQLLAGAGWTVQDGVLRDASGAPFAFDILLMNGQDEAVTNVFVDALRQLGIQVGVQLVDQAQYNERRNDYDYDMIINTWNMSLSPGNEQMLYWGSAGVTEPGTRNYMGVASPAAEAMIAHMLETRDEAEFVASVRALDRVLTTGRYVIPFGFPDVSYVAYKADLRHPETLPVYGDWIGWLPEVWWQEPG
ncbi:extracellular solute-binding protein [Amaricoccus sp.]|uniref:extracellular solute-binding protein n=1 Tax=Amaricoccus sp. TaxID=1872485 RepID=UPI002B6D4452|nr:extracellular solute-binding protein [Amaricoccus sp.]HRW14206.1 extracellular solute-binding protein [Amaricoccus sp.]